MKFDKRTNGQTFFFNRDSVTKNTGKHITDKHYHNLFEIYYITDGECSYFIDNKTYSLIPGDIILIPEGIIHNTEYNSTHSRLLINCPKSFIPASIRDILPAMTYLYRNPDTVDEVNSIFGKIEEEYKKTDSLRDDILACYTNMLFFLIARNISGRTTVEGKNTYIEQAVDYMKKNFSSSISLSEISDMCCVSPEHFSRIFKKETGFTFCEYLNLLRLQKANSMLHQVNSPSVAEIASACGFNDSNYFSLKFRQMYGVSPKKMQLSNKA